MYCRLFLIVFLLGSYINAQSVGLFFVQYDYKELNISPLKSTESGLLPGVHYTVTNPLQNTGLAFEYEGSYASGKLKYDGTDGLGEPIIAHKTHTFYDLGANVHVPLYKNDTVSSVLKIGLKYNAWDRNLEGDILENYTWWTAPISLLFQRKINTQCALSCEATALCILNARMTYSDKSREEKIDLEQKPGYIIAGTLSYQNLSLTPWVQFYQFGMGATKDLAEPDSRTYNYGILLKINMPI